MRIVTTTEQLLFDLLQEQKRTNELLDMMIPKTSATAEDETTPVLEEVAVEEVAPAPARTRRSK